MSTMPSAGAGANFAPADINPPLPAPVEPSPRLHVPPATAADRDVRRERRRLRHRLQRIALEECRTILTLRCISVSAEEAAAIFGLTVDAWLQLDARGEIPEPDRLGDYVAWRLNELTAWWQAGAPRRDDWARIRDVAMRSFQVSLQQLRDAVLQRAAAEPNPQPPATKPADQQSSEAL